jgi:hypothetical protein
VVSRRGSATTKSEGATYDPLDREQLLVGPDDDCPVARPDAPHDLPEGDLALGRGGDDERRRRGGDDHECRRPTSP